MPRQRPPHRPLGKADDVPHLWALDTGLLVWGVAPPAYSQGLEAPGSDNEPR
jgi:hypothetical protein